MTWTYTTLDDGGRIVTFDEPSTGGDELVEASRALRDENEPSRYLVIEFRTATQLDDLSVEHLHALGRMARRVDRPDGYRVAFVGASPLAERVVQFRDVNDLLVAPPRPLAPMQVFDQLFSALEWARSP